VIHREYGSFAGEDRVARSRRRRETRCWTYHCSCTARQEANQSQFNFGRGPIAGSHIGVRGEQCGEELVVQTSSLLLRKAQNTREQVASAASHGNPGRLVDIDLLLAAISDTAPIIVIRTQLA